MHEYSTRAMQHRRQRSAIQRGFLAAALVLGMACPAFPAANEEASPTSQSTLGLSPLNAAHDISVTIVPAGEEGLQLSAKLDENGGLIGRDIRWQVQDTDGQIVSDVTSPVASLALPPGSYTVHATYGSANFVQPLEIKPGNQIAVNFVFNVGAVRVLAIVDGLDLVQPPRNFIYSNSGTDRGKLITISQNPGEVLRLPAGLYRIESRVEPGNAVSVTDVTVEAGRVSAVQISHHAGLAHLSYTGTATADVRWQILSETGILLAGIDGASGTAVLSPGKYQAEAQVAGHTMSATFAVSAGKQENIVLGN